MAYEESLRNVTLLGDASVSGYTGPPGYPGSAVPNSGKIFRLVKITGKDTVGLCTADEDLSIGVLQNKPQATGAAATVGIRGISMVVAGANDLNAGDEVSSDTEGRVILAVSGKVVAGVVLADSTAVGELVPMLIRPGVKV